MRDSNLPGTELLKTVLEPLLEDFQYWFTQSRQLLETEQLSFMSDQEQSDLLLRHQASASGTKHSKDAVCCNWRTSRD